MKKELNPISAGVTLCLEKYLQDTQISLDGVPPLPSYNDLLGSYIGTYLDLFAEKIPISIKYDADGNYRGVSANIPSDVSGIYCISYEHPIDGTSSYYTGSTIQCIHKRLGMLTRLVITGKATGNESLTVANYWIKKHGKNFDYAVISYFPTGDMKQPKLRPIETSVTNHFRKIYDKDVLNIAKKAVNTLEKTEPTPVLEGLDVGFGGLEKMI